MKHFLEFSQIGKVFEPQCMAFEAWKNVSLHIQEGEVVSLIGH